MDRLFNRRNRFSLAGCVLVVLFAAFQSTAQDSLRAHAEVLDASAPFSFPAEVIVGPDRNLYFLDSALSSIFIHDFTTGKIRRLCGPESLASPSDIAVGPKGQLWMISQRHSKVTRLSRQCVVEREFKVSLLAQKIAANAFGELIVLNTTGRGALFDLFSADGKRLRSFGERIDYGEEVATAELSNGKIVPDSSGGFFFSFYYPPLVRHYGRNGRLVSEFKPESDVPIAPPDIQVRGSGVSFSVTSKYQILVLDMAADKQDRLYLLISGKNKAPALQQGSTTLRIVTKTGRAVKNITLENSFHRLAAGNRSLYLLRNRAPLRVDEYVVF